MLSQQFLPREPTTSGTRQKGVARPFGKTDTRRALHGRDFKSIEFRASEYEWVWAI